MSEKIKTNAELVMELMEFSKCGALMQVFVIGALDAQVNAVLAMEEPPEWWPPLISWVAYRACAEEVQEMLTAHYERRDRDVEEAAGPAAPAG